MRVRTKARVLGLCAASILLSSAPAWAQARTDAAKSPGNLGLGIIVGSPTGLSAKVRLRQGAAFDAALGFGLLERLHVHADYLFEQKALASDPSLRVTWFFGIGGRLAIRDENDPKGLGHGRDDEVDLGPRAPIGLEFRFPSVPKLELFCQIALGFDIVDDAGPTLDGAIGARWFF